MALNLRNKALQPVDGDDGWKAPKKPTTRVAAITPPAEAKPPHLGAALTEMPTRIQQAAEQIKAGLRTEQDRLRAQIELAQDDARRLALRMRATGQTMATTDQADLDRYIGERQDQIDSLDTQIAALDRRTADRVERGPRLFAEFVDTAKALVEGLTALQPAYDRAAKLEEDIRSLLTDYHPNGRIVVTSIPSATTGGTVLGLVQRLKLVFGDDRSDASVLDRLLTDAREAGLDV